MVTAIDADLLIPDVIADPTTSCGRRRDDPSVKSLQRIAVQDVELRGYVIRALDRTRWFIPPPIATPGVSGPETFDSTRHANQYVAFGSGIRRHLGAALDRLEGQAAFKALAVAWNGVSVRWPHGLEEDQRGRV